jgi:hypothetical protein
MALNWGPHRLLAFMLFGLVALGCGTPIVSAGFDYLDDLK